MYPKPLESDLKATANLGHSGGVYGREACYPDVAEYLAFLSADV